MAILPENERQVNTMELLKVFEVRDRETGRIYNAIRQRYTDEDIITGEPKEIKRWNIGIEGYHIWNFIHNISDTSKFRERYEVLGWHLPKCDYMKGQVY